MAETREPKTPGTPMVETASMQTIRVIHIKKPSPPEPPKRFYVDEKLPPSTASSSKSSFTFKVPRAAPRFIPRTPIRQSIITFPFSNKAPSTWSSTTDQFIFGLPRKHFYAYTGASIILFLTSVIVGLAVLSGASRPFVPPFSGLAVSTVPLSNSSENTAVLFIQDPTTNLLSLRISPDVDSLPFSPPQRLDLPDGKIPTGNMSLSATSFTSTDGFDAIFHQLFYVMDGAIMVMNISCPSISPARCEIKANDMISDKLLPTMAPDSGIAAVYLGMDSGMGWRVFYHDEKYAISSFSYEGGEWNSTGQVMGSKAVRGSSIAAAAFGQNIEVLYIDQSNTMFAVENRGGRWLTPAPISPLPLPSLSPTTSSLSLTYIPTSDVLLAYYTGLDSTIYQLIGRFVSLPTFSTALPSNFTGRTTPGWTNTGANFTRGGGGVGCIGYEGSVFVFSGGGKDEGVEMSSLNGTSGVFVPGVGI